jgi:hypothetical protein
MTHECEQALAASWRRRSCPFRAWEETLKPKFLNPDRHSAKCAGAGRITEEEELFYEAAGAARMGRSSMRSELSELLPASSLNLSIS